MWSLFPAICDTGAVLGLAGVVAHQGGWDEALPIAGPVAIVAVLVGISIRQANRTAGDDERSDGSRPDRTDRPPTGAP